ncbi:MAG TPA: IS66 family transposase zinc-finger binding domain-containing protein [Gammaproteobacteria bacterium]|nr:IS66 family transposase zinc-finger binding domain-containing protein [Gammaproteobacteria bacterium]
MLKNIDKNNVICYHARMITNTKISQKSPEQLEKIIASLQKKLASYKEKYARLLEEFRLDKNRLYSPSSEKNALQSDLFDEAGIELSDELKEQIEDEISVKSHARKKHPVRRPLPQDLPRETVIHDISDEDKICQCGSHLSRIGEEITEQLKYIPAQLSVIQHVRPKYACRPCQENVKIAPMPILFLPKCIATSELVAHTIIAKYCDHLPLYRQESI